MSSPLTALWVGTATISDYQSTLDNVTHQTKQVLHTLVSDEPCRISFSSEPASNVVNGVGTVNQTIKLFIRKDLTIEPGSVITVTQNGVTQQYRRSGEPAVYTDHQEINLKLYENAT